MYTLALFIVMAMVLETVMAILRSVLGIVRLGRIVSGLPIIGPNLTVIIAVVMVWAMGDYGWLLAGWGWEHENDLVNIVINGVIIAGVLPLKDAIFSAINKGPRP